MGTCVLIHPQQNYLLEFSLRVGLRLGLGSGLGLVLALTRIIRVWWITDKYQNMTIYQSIHCKIWYSKQHDCLRLMHLLLNNIIIATVMIVSNCTVTCPQIITKNKHCSTNTAIFNTECCSHRDKHKIMQDQCEKVVAGGSIIASDRHYARTAFKITWLIISPNDDKKHKTLKTM